MDYGSLAPTLFTPTRFNPDTTKPKCSNCAMKTNPMFSAVKADAIRRVHAITNLRNKEIFLEIFDAPREEIRRGLIEKLDPAYIGLRPKG